MKRYKPLFPLLEGKKQAIQILKKQYDDPKTIVNKLELLDPTKSNKYIELLAKLLVKDFNNYDDFEVAIIDSNVTNDLEDIENRSLKLNIDKVKNFRNLQDGLKELTSVVTQSVRNSGITKLKKGVDYLEVPLKSNDYKAYIPLNFEASKRIGSSKINGHKGNWCTTINEDDWVSYIVSGKGILVYLNALNDGIKDYLQRVAVYLYDDMSTTEIFDKNDNTISYFDLENEVVLWLNSNEKRIRKTLDIESYPVTRDMLDWLIENKKDLTKTDTSRITNMTNLFRGEDIIGDISNWDVSNVRTFAGMFKGSSFNGDISKWEISGAWNTSDMFKGSKFNGDISDWNVSNITDMSYMFKGSPLEGNEPDWYKE